MPNPEQTLAAADRVRMIVSDPDPQVTSMLDALDAIPANEQFPTRLAHQALTLERRCRKEGRTDAADALRERFFLPAVGA